MFSKRTVPYVSCSAVAGRHPLSRLRYQDDAAAFQSRIGSRPTSPHPPATRSRRCAPRAAPAACRALCSRWSAASTCTRWAGPSSRRYGGWSVGGWPVARSDSVYARSIVTQKGRLLPLLARSLQKGRVISLPRPSFLRPPPCSTSATAPSSRLWAPRSTTTSTTRQGRPGNT